MIRYGNFRNPMGLVARMLRSGNRAAYSALFREALRILLTPVDVLLSLLEPSMDGSSDEVPTAPMILVVGPPRGGTTLVSQVLAHRLEVSYASNFMALFPRSPILTGRLMGRLARQIPPAVFRSFYGQTAGLNGLHDGFFLWNRWFGEDRYVAPQEFCNKDRMGLRAFFMNWQQVTSRPFLNKNNRNTDSIRLLTDALPSAVIIVVRRDEHALVRSLIHARENVQGDKRARWGLRSKETESEDPLQYVDDVCDQVLEIERHIEVQLEQIATDRVIATTYEDFCEDPEALVRELTGRFRELKISPGSSIPEPFTPSTGKPLTPDEEARIHKRLG